MRLTAMRHHCFAVGKRVVKSNLPLGFASSRLTDRGELPVPRAGRFHKAGPVAAAVILLLASMSRAGAETATSALGEGAVKIRWQHPAGMVTEETIAEIKTKLATQEWARRLYARRQQSLQPWRNLSGAKLAAVFPRRRGNVYHNFSCPQDRCRLTFNPLEAGDFKCPVCSKVFPPKTDAGIYPGTDRYHGTMYDGWICLFHLTASDAVVDLGLLSRTEPADGQRYAARAIELLMLYAEVIEGLATKFDPDRQFSVLLTYHREGDNKVLNDLAMGYELVRERMTPAQRARFERAVLQRMLDDLMLERIYTYNHNNVYQWHRTILQVALALERADLIDWSFGFGQWEPAQEPEHRSVRKILATHFKPDGAYWEMCSGYHLYPLSALCELAVLSRHLTHMDAAHFPADRYDLTDAGNPGQQVIQNALHWFMSLAPPDRIMPTIGDSMASRGGMSDYSATAEAGYRYFGLKAVGDYAPLRQGQRSWAALLYGAPQIVEAPEPYTSSHLASGWVSLRNEWQGNRVWVGLNALIPGGGHQHADRLTLLSHSCGQLLALEKSTPYNESATRLLGTQSPAHNTVTVDRKSQKQGESLKGAEIPKVVYFLTSRLGQFAEVQADHLYPQTSIYRRSVALIEDFYVDNFRVEGGTNYDWMLHHAGAAPGFSEPMKEGEFEPADWLTNGSRRVRQATLNGDWEARWSVAGVTSRLSMLGAAPTTVYSLETYPLDNAVITPRHPPCQTLCVRRRDHGTFLAVGDAWRATSNLQSVAAGQGTAGLVLKTKANTYHLLCGPGHAHFPDGVALSSDAAFALLRNGDAVMLVHGTRLDVESRAGSLRVQLTKPASLAAEIVAGTAVKKEIAGDIQYDTFGGVDHYRPVPEVEVTIAGGLGETAKER